ncbi:MAG: ATP-binding protein [Lachnospiraceae bacterium]|jgi:uncharacterized protein YhaN
MVIRRLHIKNFGKFHDKELTFSPGINLIYGENESGKSTLYTFIQGIFFGIRRMRGRASRNDCYTRYEPWENAFCYEGQIWFTCGQKEFRLYRVFQKDRQSTSLVCETDGEWLSVEDGDLDVLLGNVSETVYRNTVSIGQLECRTGESLAEAFRNYVSNYQGNMEEELDLARALRSLKDKKKDLERIKKEAEDKKAKQLQEVETQIAYIQQEITELRDKERESQRKSEQLERGQKIQTANRRKSISAPQMGLGILAAVFLLALLCFGTGWIRNVGIIGLVCLIVLAAGYWRYIKKASESEMQKEEDQRRTRHRWMVEQLRQGRKEKQAQMENLREEYAELLQQNPEGNFWEEELEAVSMAMETIERLSRKMQTDISSQLQKRTSQILSALTAGKYTRISMDEDFTIGVDNRERHMPIEQLSKGTIEQIYFAFRMAMGEILCKEETLPVLLDDTFVMYDDARTVSVLQWLSQEKEQVLIFTCQKREQQILKELGIPYHYVQLS